MMVSISGCVSDRAPDFTNSPLYPVGYGDGCSTAIEAEKNFSSKVIRDEAMFKDDAGYRSGWRQGYVACNSNPEARAGDGIYRGEQAPYY